MSDELVDILLIKEWGSSKYGDIIQVYYGVYDTMINMKIGIPISRQEEISDKQNMVLEIEGLQRISDDFQKDNIKMYQENQKLKRRNKELEQCKDKRSLRKKK